MANMLASTRMTGTRLPSSKACPSILAITTKNKIKKKAQRIRRPARVETTTHCHEFFHLHIKHNLSYYNESDKKSQSGTEYFLGGVFQLNLTHCRSVRPSVLGAFFSLPWGGRPPMWDVGQDHLVVLNNHVLGGRS